VNPGDKMVLGSAAAGFAMVFVGGVWDGPANQPKP